MSHISFSAADWASICSHFNLNTAEVFELLSAPMRSVISRPTVVSRSFTAVADTASEASSVSTAKQYQFASSKTADFAKKMVSDGGLSSLDLITATGHGGKITKSEVKKAMPAKTRAAATFPIIGAACTARCWSSWTTRSATS